MHEPIGQAEAIATGQERFELAPASSPLSPEARGCAAAGLVLLLAGGVAIVAVVMWRDVGWWAGAATVAAGVALVFVIVWGVAKPQRSWAVEIDHDRRVLVFERCMPLRRLPLFGLHDRLEVPFTDVFWIDNRSHMVFSIVTARGTAQFNSQAFAMDQHWRKAFSSDNPGYRMVDAVLRVAHGEGWCIRQPASAGMLGVFLVPLMWFGLFTWKFTSGGMPLGRAAIAAGVVAAVLGIVGPVVVRAITKRRRLRAAAAAARR